MIQMDYFWHIPEMRGVGVAVASLRPITYKEGALSVTCPQQLSLLGRPLLCRQSCVRLPPLRL